MSDPFALLGLRPDATLDEVRAARRRLALALHPDRPGGGDAHAMGEVNRAFDSAVKAIRARRAEAAPAAGGGAGHAAPPPPPRPAPGPGAPPARGPATGARRVDRRRTRSGRVALDSPSFSIDALPAEAFEALLVVTTWLGELVMDDPPYVLEAVLDVPGPCWCRLELLPEAAGSMVSVGVDALGGAPPPPTVEEVRDAWVDALNRLGS